MEINNNNCIYHFKQIPGETRNNYINRCWFLSDLKPNKNNFDKYVQYSELWSNIKFLGCKYDDNTTKNIKGLINNEIYNFNF